MKNWKKNMKYVELEKGHEICRTGKGHEICRTGKRT